MKTYYLTNPLMKGADLKPLQKALQAAKAYNGLIDGIFGPSTAEACKVAKYRLGYATKFIRPTGGQTLLDYLNGSKELPAAYKARRRLRGFGKTDSDLIREAIVEHALWGVANAGAITYAQTRPMDHLTRIHVLPWSTDCSEFVTTISKWAGAPDPNGRNYDGLGYTGTMLDHGVSILVTDAKPGDMVIWGSFPGHHTAVIVSVGNPRDPELVSMGSDNDPRKISLSAETAGQGRPYVIKRYIKG